jgi:hypothetical protein
MFDKFAMENTTITRMLCLCSAMGVSFLRFNLRRELQVKRGMIAREKQ